MIWVPPYQLLWTRLIKASSRVWVQDKNNNVSAGHFDSPNWPQWGLPLQYKDTSGEPSYLLYYKNLNSYNNYLPLGNKWSVCHVANI